MDNKLLRFLLVMGIVLDLVISGVLLYQQVQINNNQTVSNCWDNVLNYAVKNMPKNPHNQTAYKAVLNASAEKCANLQ